MLLSCSVYFTFNLNLDCPFYIQCFNVINGGEHAGNRLAFQEFFVIPTGASSFTEAMVIGCEVFHNLKKVIKKKFGGDATLIGDEGGFAPPCNVESGLQMIMEAAAAAGYTDKISVGLDVAASEFKVKGQNAYDLDFKTSGDKKDASLMKSGDEMIAFYKQLVSEYPIVSKLFYCRFLFMSCCLMRQFSFLPHFFLRIAIWCKK
jgi:enolase